MSGQTPGKLVTMINQIARNQALEARPAAAVADHVAAFWTARMKQQILAHAAGAAPADLHPIAAEALALLATAGRPEPQTAATDPARHGTDAG